MIFLMAISEPERRSKLEKIYHLYKRDLYITAFSMLKSREESQDIVHNTILRVNEYLDKIEDIESHKTRSYLITITKNLCRDYFNEDLVKGKHLKSSVPIDDLSSLIDINNFIETNVLRDERVGELAILINELNPAYADIIRLRFYDEYSISEIAHLLGINKNNVSVRLKRALMALKKLIDERSDLGE